MIRMKRMPILLLSLTLSVLGFAYAPEDALLQRADVAAAFKYLERDYDRFVAELVTLTEIPAPPFKEAARGRAMPRRALATIPMDWRLCWLSFGRSTPRISSRAATSSSWPMSAKRAWGTPGASTICWRRASITDACKTSYRLTAAT